VADSLSVLGRSVGHEFRDKTLLERALTHRSKCNDNYERLEFLGDSILGFTVSAVLYERYPDLSEGGLTRLRAALVRKETLASLARSLDVGKHLKLGSGELKSGGFDRDSILADCLESIIGAIYRDGGIEAAQQCIRHIYSDALDNITPDSIQKDAKTLLQEFVQKQSKTLPVYRTIETIGNSHHQTFIVECTVPGLENAITGEGASRRKAEQQAAEKAYSALQGR